VLFKVVSFIFYGFWEEFDLEKSFRPIVFFILRMALLLIFGGVTLFFLAVTILVEHEGSKTEIMSMYISILYLFFWLTVLISPWRVISVSKRMTKKFLTTISFSGLIYLLLQVVSITIHEKSLSIQSIEEFHEVVLILTLIPGVLIGLLFHLNFKAIHPTVKEKDIKKEWARLSRY
jgi:uncharacterized membrane protein